ncbi:MAG: SDR family NAD(P)-dependent oxidoreductase [Acidimicrobiia bacterium]|nr:SDR family NAD(P)-dependent oxidoreductase [Acidimicrobiia bacterium]
MTNHTALVTGANSGLGLEVSAQLAERGFGRVIITARTDEKASAARDHLTNRTGKDVFETLALDNGHLDTVESAVAVLAERGGQLDLLILNAGMAPTQELMRTPDGIEATIASTLIGHHLLTVRLLERGLLSDSARIVIAGSEASRGDVPTFRSVDLDAFAATNFDGDLEAAIEAQIRMDPPAKYRPNDVYATAKVFVAWWAAELARRLPDGMTVNAVSPGSTPDTNAARNAPFVMRYFMLPFFKLIPGMSHSIERGAGRYLEAAGYGPEVTGKFFASKPKKMTGPLAEMQMAHFDDPDGQKALWNVTSRMAHGAGYPA